MSQGDQNQSAAQSPAEVQAFIEAFARVTVGHIRRMLGTPLVDAAALEQALQPDWTDPIKLIESGIDPASVDEETAAGRRYLHIDVAASPAGRQARALFLGFTGLSDKQQRALFPALKSKGAVERERLSEEVSKLNGWLDEVRQDGFDPAVFVAYQRGLGIHGGAQNRSGAVGAAGAAMAFVDAINELSPGSIVDTVGDLPPGDVRVPLDVFNWLQDDARSRTVRAILLENGRAIVFASSKDANIFEPLGKVEFKSAKEALKLFTSVAKDQAKRSQRLHEYAVGEVKTATDPANLHERMGLASRETQTELRTDRFLMMAILNREILAGGTQARVMNNKDLIRFSHVFNLHHCWGWDGGRERHPQHWQYFKDCVKVWCGL